jgi:hypothetical protein
MATFAKANDWVENESEVTDLDGDQFVVALSNTAPASETNPPLTDTKGILANITQIVYTFLSTRNLTRIASLQAAGTYKLDFDDLILTATGGSVGPFRYIYVYDDTPTSPADPIIGVYDLVTPVTITDGSSRTLKFDAAGFLTKT